jgi:CheY-like chemotaxis protein
MNSPKLNVLLADDDLDDYTFFKTALSELPVPTNLTAVNDGQQLMELLCDETYELPNVLFLDINMPRQNGFECLSEIKRNERLKDLPVIMFSTSSSRDNMSSAFKNGAHVYIRKPGNFEQLKELIYHALPLATDKLSANSQLKYILNA